MIALFADVVLGCVVLEAAMLFLLHRLMGSGPGLGRLWPTLLSGFFLVVALRLAVTEGAVPAFSAALLGALAAHATDLRRRWGE
jgi:hypothetical protein